MSFAAAPEVSVTRGDAIVIPYSAGEWALHGATGIVARPPLAN